MHTQLLFLLLITIAALSRTLLLSEIPYRVDGDAARFAIEGMGYMSSRPPLFGTGWEAHTNAYFYLVGWIMSWNTDKLLALRALSALGGILGVVATYVMARDLFSKKVALWSAFFLSITPFHLVFSRNGMEVIWTTFFAPITIVFLLKNTWYFALLAGIFAALAQYVTPISRLIPVLVVGYLFIIIFMKERGLKKALYLGSFWTVGFLAVYAPMISYYLQTPSTYWARIDRVSIFNSDWFASQIQRYGVIGAYFQQLWKSFFAFHVPMQTDYLFWYFRTPLLDRAPMVIYTLGLVVAMYKWRSRHMQWLLFSLIVGIILAGVFTTHSPMASRYTILFPFVTVCMGIGMTHLQDALRRLNNFVSYCFVIVSIVGFGLFGLYSYYRHETYDTWRYDYNAQVATYAGRYLMSLPYDYRVFFVGIDSMYYKAIHTLPFLTKKEGVDVPGPIDTYLPPSNATQKSIYIILPSRKQELEKLLSLYPKARVNALQNPQGLFLCWLVTL